MKSIELHSLSPFLDKNEVLWVYVRPKNSSLAYENQHCQPTYKASGNRTYSKGRASHYMLDLCTCLPHFDSNTGFLDQDK